MSTHNMRFCIFCHWGVQLILAYSWTRPAILVAGKGRGGMFFISSVSSLSFLFLFLPCPSLSSPVLIFLSLFSLSLGDDKKWPTRVDVSLNRNTIYSGEVKKISPELSPNSHPLKVLCANQGHEWKKKKFSSSFLYQILKGFNLFFGTKLF